MWRNVRGKKKRRQKSSKQLNNRFMYSRTLSQVPSCPSGLSQRRRVLMLPQVEVLQETMSWVPLVLSEPRPQSEDQQTSTLRYLRTSLRKPQALLPPPPPSKRLPLTPIRRTSNSFGAERTLYVFLVSCCSCFRDLTKSISSLIF